MKVFLWPTLANGVPPVTHIVLWKPNCDTQCPMEAYLVINPLKCKFGRPEIYFLGHRTTSQKILQLLEKAKAINNFEKAVFIRILRTICGMIQFYNRFLPNIALIMAPLTTLLSWKPKENGNIPWNPEATHAFKDTKTVLAQATMIHHPLHDAPTAVAVDASSSTQ